MARRHHAVPVALEGARAVQVAFANPLDEAAVTAVAKHSGRAVRALVGTFSAVRRALEREYAEPPPKTQVVDGRRRSTKPPPPSEPPTEVSGATVLPPESTKKFVDASATGTKPLHRLIEEASTEQRIEALILSLVDRGVISRSDYEDALKRLVRRG